jgi:hypothetical protein
MSLGTVLLIILILLLLGAGLPPRLVPCSEKAALTLQLPPARNSNDWHTGNFFAEVADCLNAFLIGHENVSD